MGQLCWLRDMSKSHLPKDIFSFGCNPTLSFHKLSCVNKELQRTQRCFRRSKKKKKLSTSMISIEVYSGQDMLNLCPTPRLNVMSHAADSVYQASYH